MAARVKVLAPRLVAVDARRVKPAAKRVDPFYSSAEWRAAREAVQRMRGRRCEDPHCSKPGGPWSRVFVDHREELRDGGAPLDPANLIQRCGACHTRKTLAVRGDRLGAPARGRGVRSPHP